MPTPRGIATGLVTLAVLVAAGQAYGGILVTDDNGFGGQWQGSQFYDGAYVDVDLEYCAYKPGYVSFPTNPAVDPNHHVYAYQMVAVSGGFFPDWSYASKLSVGLQADENVDVIGYYNDGTAGQISPSKAEFASDLQAAGWDFHPAVWDGEHSAILYFSSPSGPEEDTATITGFFPVGTHLLPSPAPEPATVLLLALGAGCLLKGRRRAVRN